MAQTSLATAQGLPVSATASISAAAVPFERSLAGVTDLPRRTFVEAILLSTAVPLLFGPLAYYLQSQGILKIAFSSNFVGFLSAVGNSHICLTTFFYLDGHVRSVLLRHRFRFFVAPLLVLLIVPGLHVLLGKAYLNYLNLVFTGWLLWHFSRQNWGVLCFTSYATRTAAPSRTEKWIIQWSAVGAILGIVYRFTPNTVLQGQEDRIRDLGFAIMLISQVLLIYVLLTRKQLRASLYRVAMLVLTGVFFLPVFILRSWEFGVTGFGAAHAAQYFVFMYFVGTSDDGQDRHRRFLSLAGAFFLTLMVLWAVQDVQFWGEASFIYGLAMALTVVHFVIDAGVWRLSESDQRAYVRSQFPFLFA
jgi:hypothetical protein